MRSAEGILIVALMALGPASQGEAQKCGANANSPISTDRPQITESSIVVPCGSLQLENGVAGTAFGRELSADFTETWLRFGIPAKGELRAGLPDYFTNDQTSAGFSRGFGDLTLGFKQQVGPAKGFDVSLIPSLSVPTGAAKISGHGYDPALQIPWSHAMGKNWTAAGMFSVSWPTEPVVRNLTGQASVYFDRQLTAPWDAWIEYSGSFPERGTPQNVLNMGTEYKPTPHQQVDFHWLLGLSAATPDYSVGVGYSVRFQLIRAR